MDAWSEVVESIKSLPMEEQQVLSMRFEHGMTQAQIAAALGITPAEVEVIYTRAIDRVRPKLESCHNRK